MGKKLYDWEEMRIQFMSWPYLSISQYFRDEFNKPNLSKYIFNKCNGWVDEKLVMKDRALKKATDEIEKGLVKLYTPSEKELAMWYEAVMGIFKMKAISNYQKIKKMSDWTIIIPPDVNMNENKVLWEVFKTERWEPTRITDREDFVPPTDDDEEDVIFYLPNNGRETKALSEWTEKPSE